MLPLIAASLLLAHQAVDPMAELVSSRAAAQTGEPTAAARRIAALCAAFPTWGLARIELAEALLQAGATEGPALEEAIDAARALEPENPRTWQLAGRYYELRGQTALAVEAWRRMHEARPQDLEALERLGVLLAQGGRPAEAVPLLQELLARRPELQAARANLADAQEALGDLAAAESELVALVRQRPASAVFRRRLAQFYERTGQPQKAEAALQGEPRRARNLRPLPPSRR